MKLSESHVRAHTGWGLCLCFLFAALWGIPTRAQTTNAQAQGRFVIVSLESCCRSVAWPEAEERTKAELSALNLQINLFQGSFRPAQTCCQDLAHIVDLHNALGALRIVKKNDDHEVFIDVLLDDPYSERRLGKRVWFSESIREDALLVALRTIEIILAGLLEMRLRIGEQGNVTVASENEQPSASGFAEARRYWRFGLGATGLWSPGGTDIRGALALSLSRRLTKHWALEIDGFWTWPGADLIQAGSRARWDLVSIHFWGLWRFRQEAEHWNLFVGIGAGSLLAWSQGELSRDRRLLSDQALTTYLGLRSGVEALFNFVWIRLAASLGFSAPEIQVRFGDQTIARFGKPLLVLELSAGLRW